MTPPSLFDPPSGNELALEGAKIVSTNDREAATRIDAAILYLARTRSSFTAEDVRQRAGSEYHHNLIGARFMALSRVENLIECIGYKKSKRTQRRGGILRVWKGKWA